MCFESSSLFHEDLLLGPDTADQRWRAPHHGLSWWWVDLSTVSGSCVHASASGPKSSGPFDLELDLPTTDLARCDWPSANILLVPAIKPERTETRALGRREWPPARQNRHNRRLVTVGNRALVGHLHAPRSTRVREGRSDGG